MASVSWRAGRPCRVEPLRHRVVRGSAFRQAPLSGNHPSPTALSNTRSSCSASRGDDTRLLASRNRHSLPGETPWPDRAVVSGSLSIGRPAAGIFVPKTFPTSTLSSAGMALPAERPDPASADSWAAVRRILYLWIREENGRRCPFLGSGSRTSETVASSTSAWAEARSSSGRIRPHTDTVSYIDSIVRSTLYITRIDIGIMRR